MVPRVFFEKLRMKLDLAHIPYTGKSHFSQVKLEAEKAQKLRDQIDDQEIELLENDTNWYNFNHKESSSGIFQWIDFGWFFPRISINHKENQDVDEEIQVN